MKSKVLLSAVVVTMLAACGGGGGSGDAPTTPVLQPQAPTPAVVASTTPIITQVASATYQNEELIAFNRLNSERSACGFGLLNQSIALDESAKAHGGWLLLNNFVGHYENSSVPTGYTGNTPQDRAIAAGYGVAGSIFADAEALFQGVGWTNKIGVGELSTRSLLNSPYHAIEMIRGFQDIGVSIRLSSDVGVTGNRVITAFEFGYKNSTGLQVARAGSIRTYPCEGSTGISFAMYGESPSPVPGRDFSASANPLGSSIMIVGDLNKELVINSVSVIESNSGKSVVMRAPITAANDPNGEGYLQVNEGFVAADAPMLASTKYQVIVSGASGGVLFSRSFTFTTGP